MTAPVDPAEPVDVAVVGAGRRGLLAALRLRHEQPAARVVVVDGAPQPGGSVRTQRTNGFACELGPFAFTAAEIAPFASLLPAAPPPLAAARAAHTGHVFDGAQLVPVAVDPLPWSFRSGNEELVQACRRTLGTALWLGRAVTRVDGADPFTLTLAGEVPATLRARRLVLAVPDDVAARLAAPFDPALGALAPRLPHDGAAFVFFGVDRDAAPELRGYGFVPAPALATPLAEVICCSEVFPGRALAGRLLVRAELTTAAGAAAAGAAEAAADLADAELRRWTGTRAQLGLRKVHTFVRPRPDGAWVECRARLAALPQRVPGLELA